MLHTLLTRCTSAAAVAGTMVLACAATPAQAQVFRHGGGVKPFPSTHGGGAAAHHTHSGTGQGHHHAFRRLGYNRARLYNGIFGGAYAFSYGYGGSSGSGYPGYYGYGYPGYGDSGYGYYDPYSPAAQMEAEGRYQIDYQQSRIMHQQVLQARLENRRRAFDEYLYERKVGPTWEDERDRFLSEELRRSRNEPPITEIESGKALNVLLTDLQKFPGRAADADTTVLPPEVVKHLNFTTMTGSASIGLLKDASRLAWPHALSGAEYRELRIQVMALAEEAVKEAATGGRVDRALLEELARNVARLGDRLQNNVKQTTAQDYIEARRFLTQFEDAVKALRHPDVAGYFNGRYSFQGRTVGELVKFMSERGLRFAPAVAGDEAAYIAVHQALNTPPGTQVELLRR